jgi:hypothetical protein
MSPEFLLIMMEAKLMRCNKTASMQALNRLYYKVVKVVIRRVNYPAI